jgi:hypothetical protein
MEAKLGKLQHWKGYVDAIGRSYFEARLCDVDAGETDPSVTARIPIENIPEAEREFFGFGAYLTWTVGQDDDGKPVSELVFNKERFTQDDLDRADKWAKEMSEALEWD